MALSTLKSSYYNISLGIKSLQALSAFLKKKKYSSYFILCDENTLQSCLPILITSCPELASAEIIEIESGEQSKSLEISASIWQTFIETKTDKASLLINLGGGVVSDLGGFTASVYKRGIDFIHIPTSLLAMADASVGGKTGIDLHGIKNVIGTFAQPKAVFIYPPFLKTLSKRHFQNGMAEIYKIALVANKKLWECLKDEKYPIEQVIFTSVDSKNKIVIKDPFDEGVRKTLNFGHTIGHAIESLFLGTEHELLHGEAIMIGMLMETHLSFQKKLISKKVLTDISDVLTAAFYPPLIDSTAFKLLIDLMKNDKKTRNSKFRFSLISGIGSSKYDVEINEAQIKKAFQFYNALHQ
jgi:3-dehydroquinate synthase